MYKLILTSFSLLIIFSCDEAEEILADAGMSLTGTYTVTDVMLYPNADCSGTAASGVCFTAESIIVEADCPDNGWMSYASGFEDWNMIFADDNETVTLNDGTEIDTLTYSLNANTLVISDSDSTNTITIT